VRLSKVLVDKLDASCTIVLTGGSGAGKSCAAAVAGGVGKEKDDAKSCVYLMPYSYEKKEYKKKLDEIAT